jgi:hypothetical protein
MCGCDDECLPHASDLISLTLQVQSNVQPGCMRNSIFPHKGTLWETESFSPFHKKDLVGVKASHTAQF